MNNEELWQSVLSEIELTISKANFITWFKNTSILEHKNGVITVSVPNGFTKEWLENKYHKFILRALRVSTPEVRNVSYVISTTTIRPALVLETKKKEKAEEAPEEQLDFQEFNIDKETNLNPRYTFANFIVSSFNELAHAAAQSVVKNPGSMYNPLFIYGNVGLGKTHLLQAVGNEVRKDNPNAKVRYISSETFVNDLIYSIQNNDPQKFRDNYRKFDLLIIDDIQFIAGKTKTQEEFFHTFNTLYENNKQIIFSSDRPPKSIPDLEERLRSRFEAGLIADISDPDYETRLAILKMKCINKQPEPSLEILEYVALTIERNIRELEGALTLILAKIRITGRSLTLEEAKVILSQINTKPKKVVTASKIIKEVCSFYDINERYLFERSRRREIVKPRQIAMYLLREDFHGSYPYIGQKFGGRDHTTAIHAYEKISRDLKKDQKLAEEIKLLKEHIYNS
jgi:chromosomal replication initiator protein